MVSQDPILVAKFFMAQLRSYCPSPLNLAEHPYSTGNLLNSVKMEVLTNGSVRVSIGGPQAPYFPYVNEPWTDPRWNGKKNPNEHFWEKCIARTTDVIQDGAKGVTIYD